jgi:cobalt-zinc-cadmium efflux system protein
MTQTQDHHSQHDHASHEERGAHHHAGHVHGSDAHGPDAGERRLAVALAILGSFTLVEAVGGYFANSIALLAEAAHMLADSASLMLAILAIRLGRRPANAQRTYGHRRYQPLAALLNGLALLLLTAWLVNEAILRLMHRPEVNGRLMLAIALIGGVANLIAFVALSGARSLNERGARAHVLSDLLGSMAASGAAIVILATGWTLADPLLSLFVSAMISCSGWALTRESADVLLESVPAGFDVERVERELVGEIPGLTGIHHVHVWTITGERPMVTLHAGLAPGTDRRQALSQIHTRLRTHLDIEHVTVQIEGSGPCETPGCTELGSTQADETAQNPNACAPAEGSHRVTSSSGRRSRTSRRPSGQVRSCTVGNTAWSCATDNRTRTELHRSPERRPRRLNESSVFSPRCRDMLRTDFSTRGRPRWAVVHTRTIRAVRASPLHKRGRTRSTSAPC